VREGRLARLTCWYLYVAVFLLSSQETSMVQEWFSKDLWEQYWANLGVTAENGCFYRWGKATWESLTDELDFSWKERARKLLRMYTDRSSEPRRPHRASL
jgi:trehalose-6-phosphatase